MEVSWAVAAVAAAAAVYAAVKWAAKSLNEWIYEAKLGDRRMALPPGDLGWPIIGNMLGFLRAFKSKNPETFIDSYVSRSLIFSLSSILFYLFLFLISLSRDNWEQIFRCECQSLNRYMHGSTY